MTEPEKDLSEQYLSMKQAAEQLGVVDSRIRQAVIDGSLPHVVLFGRKLIPRDALRDYEARTQPQGRKKIGRPRKKS